MCPSKPRQQPPIDTEVKYGVWANSLNERVNPCTDFYQFTCGRYITRHPIKSPADKFIPFNDLEAKVVKEAGALVFADDASTSTAVQKMRDFRNKCMKVEDIEAAKTTQLRADIKTLGGCPMLETAWVPGTFDLTNTITGLARLSAEHYLVDFDPIWAPDNTVKAIFGVGDLIIKQARIYADPTAGPKIQALETYLIEIMTVLNTDEGSPKTAAEIQASVQAVIQLDKDLAQVLVADGFQDPLKKIEDEMSKKKFNDLNTVFDAVSPIIKYSNIAFRLIGPTSSKIIR
jgi:predicted metalloendopeptidase